MKKIITYLSILTAAILFTPNTAEARSNSHGTSTYVSGHSSCGCPIYTKKVFVSNDRYGRPIFKYYSVASNCKCKSKSNQYRPSSRYTTNRSYHSQSKCSNKHHSRGHYNNGTQVRVTYRR